MSAQNHHICQKLGCGLNLKPMRLLGVPVYWACPRNAALGLLQRLDKQEAPCTWTDDDDGLWTSTCGLVDWAFNDGGPVENKVKFCLGRGRPVIVRAALTGASPLPSKGDSDAQP